MPEDIEAGGIDAVCPDCAKKYGEGIKLTSADPVRLIELPLNARLEDVVGGIDERAALHDRMRVRRGILAQADRNLLYIDEINLLGDDIMDSILDAAAQGSYTVRRGPLAATCRSRFVLIGSMNPEEGCLRPQILDRFGLRVIVRGLENIAERLEAYRRVQAYLTNPRQMVGQFSAEMEAAAIEIRSARERVKKVMIPDRVANPAIELVQRLGIDSLRAENTLLLPGEWTTVVTETGASVAAMTVTLVDGEQKSNVNFGWDYQFLPLPDVATHIQRVHGRVVVYRGREHPRWLGGCGG